MAKHIHYKGMASILRLGGECSAVVDKLMQNRVLRRGMAFCCEARGISHWYPLNQLDDVIPCAGCTRLVQLPAGAKIHFRLNELADQAVCQGAIPVLLTRRLLELRNFEHTLALYGLKLNYPSPQGTEIDFVTTHKGQLLLAECKEYKKGADATMIQEANQQLSNLVTVAAKVKAPIVLLSTLISETPPEMREQALKLSQKHQLAVHLVALTEMKFVHLTKPSELVEAQNVNLLFSLA